MVSLAGRSPGTASCQRQLHSRRKTCVYLGMAYADDILRELRRLQAELKTRYPIRSMALFGSVVRGDFGEGSDVDILVEFDGRVGSRFIDLAEELEAVLQRKVDLVSRGGIKTGYFTAIQSELRYV